MATMNDRAVLPHKAKVRHFKIVSNGMLFEHAMGPPADLHFTFEGQDGKQVELRLLPQEVEEVRLACTEFNARRESK